MPDVLLPVPISAWRLAKRHYNQATLLCDGFSCELDIPINQAWASRKGFSVQHHLSKLARAENANRVFSLSKQCIDDEIAAAQCDKDGSDFTVAIVDDVLTTGVTVNTLSKRLKQRYPKIQIQVWAAAFTPPPKSSLYQRA